MKRFRLTNKLYANKFGYFWEPCPVCKEYFGGHEWKLLGGLAIKGEQGHYDGICDDCERIYKTNSFDFHGKDCSWDEFAEMMHNYVFGTLNINQIHREDKMVSLEQRKFKDWAEVANFITNIPELSDESKNNIFLNLKYPGYSTTTELEKDYLAALFTMLWKEVIQKRMGLR
jgi:hypothetical protein